MSTFDGIVEGKLILFHVPVALTVIEFPYIQSESLYTGHRTRN